MRKLLLLLLTFPLFASNWSLEDQNGGWNTRDLVELYFHNSELQTQWAFEALSNYRMRGNERVLDFGCGEGKLSSLMAFMVPQGSVTAVDISEEMLYFASKMFPQPNLSFKKLSDVDFATHFIDQKFDLITSFCVFHLVPRPLTVLQNLRAIMDSDGYLVMTYPTGGNLSFFEIVRDEMQKRGWSFPRPTSDCITMRRPDAALHLIKAAGFDVIYAKHVPNRSPFSSKEKLIDWFEGTLTANWNLPKEQRRAFFEVVADRYLAANPQEVDKDGFVYFYCGRFDVVAKPAK